MARPWEILCAAGLSSALVLLAVARLDWHPAAVRIAATVLWIGTMVALFLARRRAGFFGRPRPVRDDVAGLYVAPTLLLLASWWHATTWGLDLVWAVTLAIRWLRRSRPTRQRSWLETRRLRRQPEPAAQRSPRLLDEPLRLRICALLSGCAEADRDAVARCCPAPAAVLAEQLSILTERGYVRDRPVAGTVRLRLTAIGRHLLNQHVEALRLRDDREIQPTTEIGPSVR